MTEPVLEARGIVKRYGSRLALGGVSLAVRPGEVVGLLGPNGAGKTTALSILATVLRPDAGELRFRREPGAGTASLLGLVPQSLALYPTLGVAQNVLHFGRMQGMSRAASRPACADVLERVGLADRAGDVVRTLSGGMRRRLNLACGIVHGPSLLLLDEPTVGVDLESRERILDLVREIRDAGAGVVYSTHYMEEAERLCDRVLLIDGGRLVADGTVAELTALAGNRPRLALHYRGALPPGWPAAVAGARLVEGPRDERVVLEVASHADAGEVLASLRAAGVAVLDFRLHSPDLADAFVALTGHSLRDLAA